jgi:hypothetical protein
MHHNHVADFAGIDFCFEVGRAQPGQAGVGDAGDARGFDRGNDAIGLIERHRHGLSEQDVLAGFGSGNRQLGERGDRRREMDNIDVLAREEVVIVLVPMDAKRLRKRVDLFTVWPRRRDQLRAGILRQRAPEVVGGIPVTEAENCDAVFAIHECSGNQFPVTSFQ